MNSTPAVNGLRARYFGAAGGSTTRYYWVQAIYPWGRSTLASTSVANTNASLAPGTNFVALSWAPAPGAIGYDVLYSSSSTTPAANGSYALAKNLTAAGFTDDGSITAFTYGVDFGANLRVARALYSFGTDGGAQGTITPTNSDTIPDNAIIVGSTINSPTAATSNGSATVAVGTSAGSSTTSIKGATAIASLTADALLNGVPVFATPVKLTAAGRITFTIGTADLTAGVIEVFVFYVIAAA